MVVVVIVGETVAMTVDETIVGVLVAVIELFLDEHFTSEAPTVQASLRRKCFLVVNHSLCSRNR